jgi:formylglycine-generating enzyme required for sulfatase activity
MTWREATVCVLTVVFVLAYGVTAPAQVIIEMTTVGDPANIPDDEVMPTDGTTDYGGVAYIYRIGRYEVTNSQYAEFLNAVAASDPNGLYNVNMGSGYGGITRSGSPGSYTYSPIEGRGNMPVNYVRWYDTLRFANWMHNGQPTFFNDPATTENGAYDMSLGSGVVRKPGARVFLPSEDEWYKVAYYKGGSADAGYWDCPTQSDTFPMAEGPPGTDFANGSANYDAWSGYIDLTYVGSYTAKPSDSAYGTFDQGGNVSEWNEDVVGSYRGVRGGSFADPIGYAASYGRYYGTPTNESHTLGFRAAGVAVLDGDDDVDLYDYALWQIAFTGPR